MPLLLEDLAEETSASNRRAADRLDAEARDLGGLRGGAAGDELRREVAESAHQAADYAALRAAEAEGVWGSALAVLRKAPAEDKAHRILRAALGVFESGLRLVRAARALCEMPEPDGAAPERLEELDRAGRRFEELAAEAAGALEHRERGWRPADPERLALGLQLAREGKTVKADEARTWFRKSPG